MSKITAKYSITTKPLVAGSMTSTTHCTTHCSTDDIAQARYERLMEAYSLIDLKLTIVLDRLNDLVCDEDLINSFETKANQPEFNW